MTREIIEYGDLEKETFPDLDEMQNEFAYQFSVLIKRTLNELQKNYNKNAYVKDRIAFEKGNDIDMYLTDNLRLLFSGALTQKSMDKWAQQ
jgi:hypothetical protein|tara:strand:- start:659 stop:931 length:273 start_codon:yes stop_codon:yes gene_type:complete